MHCTLAARRALTPTGWQSNVHIEIADGRIVRLSADSDADHTNAYHTDVLLPAPSNLHSHSFQRAMAGLTEARGDDPTDNFWTWRDLMYRFLERLTPDDIEAIAAFVFMEMAEAGYGAVAEFHYLHHQPNGSPYANVAETSERIAAGAHDAGIGLTLLPVLYQQGGCDGRPLTSTQLRFANDEEEFAELFSLAKQSVSGLGSDSGIGVAPHSLRAVTTRGLRAVTELDATRPIHIHVAEQSAEVDEVLAYLKTTPARWLLDNMDVDARYCFIHGTQMDEEEIKAVAEHGVVMGLCPITEANLGDGIFDARALKRIGGGYGVGSDSNVQISLADELRLLEYGQRLKFNERAVIASADRSTGRMLLEDIVAGGTQALGRDTPGIAVGAIADLVSLDTSCIDLMHRSDDALVDSFVFAGTHRSVQDLWSGGRHIVRDGRHVKADLIRERYRATLGAILNSL